MGSGVNTGKIAEDFLQAVKVQTRRITEELLEIGRVKSGQILVVGCSSSEIAGTRIGTFSSEELGRCVFEAVHAVCQKKGVYVAAQCCEHLNRALILEREAAEKYGYDEVNVMPQLKAGGSFATAAWKLFGQPTAVERVRAHAGIDIGDTLIGMHLREVAVPVRTSVDRIGNAHVVCARVRAKFVGGSRAAYNEELL